MKNQLLEKVEEIINTLACNDKQPIEVRGAFNAAINLRAMLEQIQEVDMDKPVAQIAKAKEVKEEPTRWILPNKDNKDNKTKE